MNTSKHSATEKERSEYIFSKSTKEIYNRHCSTFVDYLRQNNNVVKTVEQARPFVADFLKSESETKSAWTVHSECSALAKAYGCTTKDFGVTLPARERQNIVRGTTDYSSHHFSEVKHSDLVNLCKCTGLRRNEVEHLKGTDIQKTSEGFTVHVAGTYAKGGRERTIEVYNRSEDVLRASESLLERFIGKDTKVIDEVPKTANIHSYRAEYAQSLYEKYARPLEELETSEKYICRKEAADRSFDREAVQKVTENLGHSRLNVCVSNYLLK